jgi:hypothetical protein
MDLNMSHSLTLADLYHETSSPSKCGIVHGCSDKMPTFVDSNRVFASVNLPPVQHELISCNKIKYLNPDVVNRGSLFRLINKAASGELLDLRRRLRMALDVVCIGILAFAGSMLLVLLNVA